jgi:hypothetical protein
MNDYELSTAVRESVADIHSDTPVAQIISRGRAVRARRRITGVAGALTLAAGTALAVTTTLPSGHPGLLPSGHPVPHPASVRLAAWTVARQANGDIDITINQLKDPAGLQATLRAEGLPATVSFSGPMMSAYCQPYAAGMGTLRAVAQFHSDYLTIDPNALPSGARVAIFDAAGTGLPANPSGTTPTHAGTPPTHPFPSGSLLKALNGPLAVGLVYASQRCTG